jgi:imidazolonepropionase-like amidohydrolase
MGVEASIRKIFEEAKQYKQRWDEYNASVKRIKNKEDLPLPPRKDLRLEVVNDILNGKLWIRCHAYQAPEMLSIMKLCKEYGVKLACYEHGLEGYRIADELKEYGVAVSTFADFWGYKWEAFFTMPHSIAIMAKRGVLVAINSDDPERMRRLFLDAAKTIRFGGVSEIEALKMITINPAKILGIDKWTGTLEEGKDADIAVFNRYPLDPYTVCEMTIVEGKIYFDRAKYLEDMKKAKEERKKAEEKRKKAEEAKKKAEEDKKKAEEARKEEPQKVKPDNIEI